jgi:hypothetical protein
MDNLSKRLEQFIESAQRRLIKSNNILPVKTDRGILVGSVLIISQGSIKHLEQYGELIYQNISLNIVAIKLANMISNNSNFIQIRKIYEADQEYGKNFVKSQMLRNQYQKYLNNKDFEKADIIWARYNEYRAKTEYLKNQATRLASFE